MRKLILGLTAAAAIATPVAVAGSAQAATAGTGTLDTTTYADGHTYVHQFAADYTCSTVNGRSVVNFAIAGITPSGSGTGVLTPDSKGGGVFAFSGANGNYGYSYGGTYDASGAWSTADATAGYDGASDEVYDFGSDGTRDGFRGSVTGSFTGVPDCITPEVPPATTDTHGQCVSGATHDGVKGTRLAAIAKDVTKVGAYPSATCPKV